MKRSQHIKKRSPSIPKIPHLYRSLAKMLYHHNPENISEAMDCNQKAIYYELVASYPQFISQHWHNGAKLRVPEFLIIGMRKCGTTSLIPLSHGTSSRFCQQWKKEIFFLSRDGDLLTEEDQNWYFSHFPKRPEGKQFITGEASTTYIDTPGVHKKNIRSFS